MMTRNQANVMANAILQTLDEMAPGCAPEGVLYSAVSCFGYTLDDFRVLVQILIDGGAMSRPTAFELSITAKGCQLADMGRKAVARG